MTARTNAWKGVGDRLGWATALVSEGSMFGWSFASFRRELREPPMPEGKRTPWLHGVVDGATAIARPEYWLQYPVQAALDNLLRSQFEPPAPPTAFTFVMAEIDPPLFCGTRMLTKPSLRYGTLPKRSLATLRDARLNDLFWVVAHDAERLEAVLGSGATTMTDLLAETWRHAGIALHDGLIELFVEGGPDPVRVSLLAGRAARLARELSARSRALPPRPADVPLQEDWSRLASATGLAFDAQRWQLFGQIRGVEVEVLLETGHGKLASTVRATLRRPLGCGLSLRTALEPERPALLRRRAPGKVEVGHVAFDGAFVIDALAPELGRQALAAQPARRALLDLSRGTSTVLLNDQELLVAEDGWAPAARLEPRIARALELVDVLTPAHAGAYR